MSAVQPQPDWDAPPAPRGSAGIPLAPIVIAWVLVVVGIAAAGAALGSVAAGAAAAIVVAVGTWLWMSSRSRAALRAADAIELGSGEKPRFRNLAEGLAEAAGVDVPKLFHVPEAAPNALVTRAHGGAIALTDGLLADFSRTEIEAVVAHCMVRLASPGDLWRTSLQVALSRPGIAPRIGHRDDVRAAALTRYPPGLAAAIRKSKPRSGRFAPFWFVGEGPSHRDPEERARDLMDL